MKRLLFFCFIFCSISLNLSAYKIATPLAEKSFLYTIERTKKSGAKKDTLGRVKKKSDRKKSARVRARSKTKNVKKNIRRTSTKKIIHKKVTVEIELDDFSRCKGTFSLPLSQATIKTGFGPYKIGLGGITGYNPGLTFEAEQGSTVQSVFKGVVTDLFEMEGTWAITIQHGNYFTVYANLSSVNVSQYETIASGTIIGNAASNKDGYAELEFLIMKKNKNIDPEPWIRKN